MTEVAIESKIDKEQLDDSDITELYMHYMDWVLLPATFEKCIPERLLNIMTFHKPILHLKIQQIHRCESES